MLLKNQARKKCGISSLRLNTIPSHIGCDKTENNFFYQACSSDPSYFHQLHLALKL